MTNTKTQDGLDYEPLTIKMDVLTQKKQHLNECYKEQCESYYAKTNVITKYLGFTYKISRSSFHQHSKERCQRINTKK